MYANIQIIGDDRGVAAMLLRMNTAINPISIAEFLGVVADPYIRGRAEDRFLEEGDDVTGQWAPLEDSTVEMREHQGFGGTGPINMRTGELEEYITGTPGDVMPGGVGVTLTSPGRPPSGHLLTKVKTAQSGKGHPRTPPRPVIGMNESDTAFVLTALSGFIVRKVAR